MLLLTIRLSATLFSTLCCESATFRKWHLKNTYLENGQLESKHLENDIWKMKNIQHGLVPRGRLVSGQFKKFFRVNKLELLDN